MEVFNFLWLIWDTYPPLNEGKAMGEERVVILCGNLGSVYFEMSFWCLQFSQKTNKIKTCGTIVVNSNSFLQFLGELKIPKRHLEIYWNLASTKNDDPFFPHSGPQKVSPFKTSAQNKMNTSANSNFD